MTLPLKTAEDRKPQQTILDEKKQMEEIPPKGTQREECPVAPSSPTRASEGLRPQAVVEMGRYRMEIGVWGGGESR